MNPNQKEKLSCEERSKRKTELQAEQEKLRVEEEAVIAMEEKRKLGVAKQRVETVLVEILGPDGHVGRCHIPTAAVVQLGLFRILLGSVSVRDTNNKTGPFTNSSLGMAWDGSTGFGTVTVSDMYGIGTDSSTDNFGIEEDNSY